MHTATYTFPTSNCSYPSAYDYKFPGKKVQAEQEVESHKIQGPALRLCSKSHSLGRSAKNRKAVSNGSQIGAGRKKALDRFLSNAVITEAKPMLPCQGSNGRSLTLVQGKAGAQTSTDLGTTCKVLQCCEIYLP